MALLHYTIFNLGLLRHKVATLENYTMAPHNKGRPLSSLTRGWQVRPSSVTCLLSDPAVPSPVRGTYLFLFVPTEIGVILTVINLLPSTDQGVSNGSALFYGTLTLPQACPSSQ